MSDLKAVIATDKGTINLNLFADKTLDRLITDLTPLPPLVRSRMAITTCTTRAATRHHSRHLRHRRSHRQGQLLGGPWGNHRKAQLDANVRPVLKWQGGTLAGFPAVGVQSVYRRRSICGDGSAYQRTTHSLCAPTSTFSAINTLIYF